LYHVSKARAQEYIRKDRALPAALPFPLLNLGYKLGPLINKNVKAGNPTGSNQYHKVAKSNDVTLANLGVTRNESSRLQKIANIPEDGANAPIFKSL
jgi:hypothetical protein